MLPPILGEDPAFLDAVERCSRLAGINRPCLVVGERGTGKELLSARVHYLSARWNGPLVKVNCAALSETLLESELFGHEMGAFTGAQRKRPGRFELAHSGTLILDEIANASTAVQEKVLRVIEYGEFERVGGTETQSVDVRIVAGANQDLPSLVRSGKFRADLLDRLSFDVVTIPPLRVRTGDILPMAEAFAREISHDLGLEAFHGFSAQAQQLLLNHTWPGNVRELRNVVERSLFSAIPAEGPIEDIRIDPFDSPWRPVEPDPVKEPGEVIRPDQQQQNFGEAVAAFEVSLIEQALTKNRHVQKDAAEWLGLGYHQFRRLLDKYNLR